MPTASPAFVPPAGTTAERLIHEEERVISRWLERLNRAMPSAQRESSPVLIDTLPAFLDKLAEALAPNHPRSLATESTSIATEHGSERARVTRISAAELIIEYQILRDTLFEVLYADVPVPESERQVIIRSIDQAMSESLTAFFLVHQDMREQFSITLTHDLRSPLTAILAGAELLLRAPDRPHQVPIIAARIIENSRRIDRMIQDLLDASRARFGERPNYEVAPFELLSLVRETIDDLSTIHGDRFSLQGEAVEGYWNRDAFKRAIENLLVNAVKYGDPGTRIRVILKELHGRVVFSVSNIGPPIPVNEQMGLFNAFMRTQSATRGENQGWGLGLTMVRAMAEGHGGSVTVASGPGRETTFTIDVPRDSRPFVGTAPTTQGT